MVGTEPAIIRTKCFEILLRQSLALEQHPLHLCVTTLASAQQPFTERSSTDLAGLLRLDVECMNMSHMPMFLRMSWGLGATPA